ncbi:predicted protein [Lichtheimia corymbifera JMRC:FSU:9682]|uniref:Uncharacterized protein n=1 Tax=Lichtheimia corymbifera JMRC:FSU:9682 TaxID=1263082 RepID=A0A068RXZ7_9FUNG|nr:predicted protein [Lichtheimia corymbifera JMRC:FSU:9682]
MLSPTHLFRPSHHSLIAETSNAQFDVSIMGNGLFHCLDCHCCHCDIWLLNKPQQEMNNWTNPAHYYNFPWTTVPTQKRFIDHAVPILNYFADNVGVICFEWGEKIVSHHAVTLSIMDCEGETPNYADGIGYATRAGILDDERILVECSSGAPAFVRDCFIAGAHCKLEVMFLYGGFEAGESDAAVVQKLWKTKLTYCRQGFIRNLSEQGTEMDLATYLWIFLDQSFHQLGVVTTRDQTCQATSTRVNE